MTSTMRIGPLKVGRVLGDEADGSVQVATGIEPETGDVVVIVRLGNVVAAMTPAGAAQLADGIKAEAAYALVQEARAKGGLS